MKLVLFDIDGTLIYHVALTNPQYVGRGPRFDRVVKRMFHVPAKFNFERHNGTVDRYIIWDMVRSFGITREEFEKRFTKDYPRFMQEEYEKDAKVMRLYEPIKSAVRFLQLISKDKTFRLGIITGNAERIAWWKLDYIGIRRYFRFGLFGDEADSRIELAQRVYTKANAYFHTEFMPEDLVIIGDTIHDVRCGKAVGATTIAVTTGYHNDRSAFENEHPDFLVDSLTDKRILTYFGISEHEPA